MKKDVMTFSLECRYVFFLFRRFFEVQWAYIFGILSSAKERRWEGMPPVVVIGLIQLTGRAIAVAIKKTNKA